MRTALATASAVLLAAMTSALPAQTATPRVYTPRESSNAPQIDLWLDQVQYHLGDRVAPHFVTEDGAYVTILRITTDGQLQVLYPRRAKEQQPFARGQLVNDRVPYNSIDRRFEINESRGMGFVFAVSSFDKFDYSYYNAGGDWSVGRLANDGRIGDPFDIVRRFVDRTLTGGADFSMDYVSYEVDTYGVQSQYATRYRYNSYDDYYDSCLSAFGYSYSGYCQPYYPGTYPIVVSQPSAPRRNVPGNYAGKHIKPLVGDPLVHGAPSEPQIATEGRLPEPNRAEEAALAARRERLLRQAAPRDRSPSNVDVRQNEPRIYIAPERPRVEPQRVEPQRVEPQRVEPPRQAMPPRPEPRVESRAEPRALPQSPPPRVEVRNEPPPQRVETPHPAPAPTPVAKDHSN